MNCECSLQVVRCARNSDLQKLRVSAEVALLVRPDGHIAWRPVAEMADTADSTIAYQQLKEILQELKS